jgi:hypothetical protein
MQTRPCRHTFTPRLSQHTTHNSQLTTHNSQLTTHNSQLTTHNSQLTTHNSQLTTHNSQLTTHNLPNGQPSDSRIVSIRFTLRYRQQRLQHSTAQYIAAQPFAITFFLTSYKLLLPVFASQSPSCFHLRYLTSRAGWRSYFGVIFTISRSRSPPRPRPDSAPSRLQGLIRHRLACKIQSQDTLKTL